MFNPTYRLQNINVSNNATLANLTITQSLNIATGAASYLDVNSINATGANIQNLVVSTGTIQNAFITNLNASNVSTLNSSGANSYLENLAVNNSIATQQLIVGYNGASVIGVIGQDSLVMYGGDLSIRGGNIKASGNLSLTGSAAINTNLNVLGTSSLSNAAILNENVINSTITNLSVTNLTGTNVHIHDCDIHTLNVETGSVSELNVNNMSGSNAFIQNVAVNNGLATQQLTIGYNGLEIVGLIGQNSLVMHGGDMLLENGNIHCSNNINTTGAIQSSSVITSSISTSNASIAHLYGALSSPTIASSTSGVHSTSIVGKDLAGKLSFSTTGTDNPIGNLVTISFNTAFSTSPYVVFSSANADAADAFYNHMMYVSNVSSTGFAISTVDAITTDLTCDFNYMCIA